MQIATLVRGESSVHGTFGALRVGVFTCMTLELPWKDNRRQLSCIPVGRYRCEVKESKKFGLVYQVLDVPERSGILIHPANFGGDSEQHYDTQLQGCIALGTRRVSTPARSSKKWQYMLVNSRATVREFMDYLQRKPFQLEVTNA